MGLLQGFTEFLPVSSSGHLLLAEKLFRMPENLFFNLMLHLGSLVAVIFVYRKSIWSLLRHPFSKKTLYLLLACVPTFVLAFVFRFYLEDLVNGAILPVGFALTAILLVLGEQFGKNKFAADETNAGVPLLTGFVQGLAVLPGLSRSGSTISAMCLCGVRREDAGEFSFLLSIPIILGSALVECLTMSEADWADVAVLPTAAGVICAAVSGYLAIKFVLRLLKTAKMKYFAAYLVIPFLTSLILL